MVDDTGRVAIVFNGEIYNYRELRDDLSRQGVRFRTDSDTEVILRLYERQGASCVQDLRGMFAFAIWDDHSERLLLARDRIGKKPLYYFVEDGSLYFASSLEALSECRRRSWEIDASAVDSFLSLSYIPAPRTVYRQVSKLSAGTLATIAAERLEAVPYWKSSREAAPFEGSFPQAVDRLHEILNAAVSLRLRSDVPLGIFLSGGIDSSLVAAVASRSSATPVATFSIAFDAIGYDESAYAERVSRELGTEHHVFHARPDILRTLPEMVRHFGEPFADSSALAVWMLAQETRKHVTVALGGDGGDEAFAGYDWYTTAARLRRVSRAVPSAAAWVTQRMLEPMLRSAFPQSRAVGQLRRAVAMATIDDEADRYAALRSFVGPDELNSLYRGELLELRRTGRDGALVTLAALHRDCDGSDLRRMRHVDINTYLADCLMPKIDVATMAHSLEVRAPLLDQELVRFALTLPDEWLIDRRERKRILRAVLSRYLPIGLFRRSKRGFSMPLGKWFREDLQGTVSRLANSERLLATGWFKQDGIRSLINEQMRGIRDHTQRLFSLLVLDEWLKRV